MLHTSTNKEGVYKCTNLTSNVSFLFPVTASNSRLPYFNHIDNEVSHNEELHDLYSSPSIVRVIKSRRIRWAWHVARMGRREACIWFWWRNLKERYYWGDPGIDGRIILRWTFRKWVVVVWTGLGWLRIGTGGGKL
jgi:hypothetical protein